MSVKKAIISILLVCMLAGAFQAPALADGYTSLYSGWVNSGQTTSANGCIVIFDISNSSGVHVSIHSPNYAMADAYIPVGQSVYYYDALRIYVGEVNYGTNQALVDLSKPLAGSSSTGTKLSSDTPGQTALAGDRVTFPIIIQNNNGDDKTYTLSATGATGWGLSFEYGGRSIYQVTVPASQSKTVNLIVQTPYSASIGEKSFTVKADDASLDVRVDITSVNQSADVSPKVSTVIAYVGDKVYYDFSVQNLQSQDNDYKLSVTSMPDDNWYYRFINARGNTDELAETVVPGDATQNLVLEIVPPYNANAGTYNFTAVFTTPDNISISKDLTLILKSGTSMSVTSDKLAYDAKPGQTFDIKVYVANTGSGAALTNVYPSVTAPSGWIVSSSPNITTSIKPGETQIFTVSVQPPGNIVASDYSVSIDVKSDQAHSASDYRITITTESYIPYIGGALIIVVLAGLAFMYRKYGRR